MSFVSIRCPNCAASESIKIDENQYQCRCCDNTFHYANPDTPKRTVQEVQSYHCPICGRGVTAGTSNKCTICGTSDLCSNCTLETSEKKLICKNCLVSQDYCLTCGKDTTFRCHSCVKLHEKDPSHVITRFCSEHIVENVVVYSKAKYFGWSCSHCGGLICINCLNRAGWKNNCKNCGNKVKEFMLTKDKDLKNENKSFTEWFTELSELAKSAENKLQRNKSNP
ncbi:MAG: hypothetical protein EPO62_06410 [Candidatus Nitrosotenuis sp.]|nr:MAG: hypothetical protein EPO62_06410 [Candidatus Nitrosotenuis sp.]